MVKDRPKTLADPDAKRERLAQLSRAHIAPLTRFVRNLRRRTRLGPDIPYFDPLDGGVGASCLFLFEAPGPKAVETGFVSRNNHDESARNFFELSHRAGLPRQRTVLWNIVPWYVGGGGRIRAASRADIAAGRTHLARLLPLLPQLRVVVLSGRKAQVVAPWLEATAPRLRILTMPHTSPQFVNRAKGNRQKLLRALRRVVHAMKK